MTTGFWQGRRVLLTGHTGFKGGWLALWLQHLGARVTGYALAPPTTPSLFETARVAAGMASLEGDVRDLDEVVRVVGGHQPEVVVHMAAQPLVRYSYRHPVETYATNVMGTVHVLEAVRRSDSVRVVVNITSDKCYENRGWVWGYREAEPMGGHDPYSSSKGCAELVSAAYRRSFLDGRRADGSRVGVATVRAGNVIGGGDWAEDRLVPDIVRAMTVEKPVVVRNPRAVRPWQHVLEPLYGYLLLAEKLWEDGGSVYADSWNFGPDDRDTQPVLWVVEQALRLWGGNVTCTVDPSPQPHEASFLKLDSSKAKALLGWRPKLSLAEALQWTVEWFRALQSGGDMRAITERQIADFMSR